MFSERTPTEEAHAKLMAALGKGDYVTARLVMGEHPQAVQPDPQWSKSPFQELVGHMFSWQAGAAELACMDTMIECGASPMQSFKYYPQPMFTLLERGVVAAFERMHAQGRLSEWLKQPVIMQTATSALHAIFTATTWKNYSGDYPIVALTKLFLEAGADPLHNIYSDTPVIDHALWTAMPSYGFPRPKGMQEACKLLLQADTKTPITATHLMQAWRAGFNDLAPILMERYTGGGKSLDDAELQGKLVKMKDEDAASFRAWCLEAQRAPSMETRAGRPRF